MLKYFSFFPKEQVVAIYMKFQILFSAGKKKKYIINLSSAELAQRMVTVICDLQVESSCQSHWFSLLRLQDRINYIDRY